MQSITRTDQFNSVKLTTQQIQKIADHHGAGALLAMNFHSGSMQAISIGLSTAENPIANSLVFTSSPEALQTAIAAKTSIIIAHIKSIPSALPALAPHQALFCVDNISVAMANILPLFDDKKTRLAPQVSPRASISANAKIGENVIIGDFVVVGDFAQVGDDTTLAAHVTIESHAIIGSHCHLHPQVVIGARCQVGNRCEIHSCTVIGSDGFSFYTSKDLKHHKIPQVGIVVLEDDVEIGANCALDRATLTETRIGAGTKLDNQIHIAHNVRIGKNCRITAGFTIAGSSQIGDNFLCGGNTAVTDHVNITHDVMLSGRSTVTKDISKPGAYGGYPLEPLKTALKTLANITHLSNMRKQLNEIRKHLGLKDVQDPESEHL